MLSYDRDSAIQGDKHVDIDGISMNVEACLEQAEFTGKELREPDS